MNFFTITKLGRTMLLAAAVVAAAVGTSAAQTGTFKDSRDGKTYKTVKMPDGKTWMAQNLNYKADSSGCYQDDDSKCQQYGRLYNWDAAKAACPAGWHLPSKEEWVKLINSVGGFGNAKALKATKGWVEGGNGTDKFGFSATPGGLKDRAGYENEGRGYWWASTAVADDKIGFLCIISQGWLDETTGEGMDEMGYYEGSKKGDRRSLRCIGN